MLKREICYKVLSTRLGAGGLSFRDAGCIRPAHKQGPRSPYLSLGGEVLLDVYFLDEAHCRSGGSVGCLNGARLVRSQDG